MHPWHMKVLSLGVESSYSCQPVTQPQQHQILAVSVTYSTAHSNAGSFTHWARPGIEAASSWILVGFVSAVPQQELPIMDNNDDVQSWWVPFQVTPFPLSLGSNARYLMQEESSVIEWHDVLDSTPHTLCIQGFLGLKDLPLQGIL